MYDALTGRFTFACPSRGEARVTLSAFRQLERLPGAAHPAVYRVLFACGCGQEHEGLVAHEHVDLPGHNDTEIGVVEHVFADDVARTVEAFRAELYSARFDARRIDL